MKFTLALICFLSSLVPLLAYPMDYNETTYNRARDALNNLQSLIYENNFPKLFQEYSDEISQIDDNVHEQIRSINSTFNERLDEVLKITSNFTTNVTDCTGNFQLFSVEEYYQNFIDECVRPARDLGVNIVSAGYDKQAVVFYKKFEQLISGFNGCTHDSDPAPYICAGVVEYTYREVDRILPSVKVIPLQVERQLQQQILVVSNCASTQVLVSNKRLQVEFNNAKTCILDKLTKA